MKARGVNVAHPKGLVDWMARETKLGNPALEKAVAETGDADLKNASPGRWPSTRRSPTWSAACRPFPYVRPCLERFAERADMIVCSQTPNAALEAEWKEHDIDQLRDGHLRPGNRQQEGIAGQRQTIPGRTTRS